MMDKIEMLKEMKTRRGNETIILFHNGDHYEAYAEDAKTVSAQLNIEAVVIDTVLTVRIPETQQESATNSLADAGYATCVSDMRDSDGNFVAKINIIQDE